MPVSHCRVSTAPSGARAFSARAPGPIPDVIDLRGQAPPILDQGQYSDCCGCAMSSGLWMANGLKGRRPSELSCYSLARADERAYAKEPLVDDGCQPAHLVRALHRWGIAAADDWPLDVASINADPTWDQIQACVPVSDGAITEIVSYSDDRLQEIDAALSLGLPVFFCTKVDAPYESLVCGEDYVWEGMTQKSEGWHAQLIVGKRPGAYLVRNSWSISFGSGGYVWMDSGIIATASRDPYVIHSSPVL